MMQSWVHYSSAHMKASSEVIYGKSTVCDLLCDM